MIIEVETIPCAITRFYAGTYRQAEGEEGYEFTVATSSDDNHDETLLSITWTNEPTENLAEIEEKIREEFGYGSNL